MKICYSKIKMYIYFPITVKLDANVLILITDKTNFHFINFHCCYTEKDVHPPVPTKTQLAMQVGNVPVTVDQFYLNSFYTIELQQKVEVRQVSCNIFLHLFPRNFWFFTWLTMVIWKIVIFFIRWRVHSTSWAKTYVFTQPADPCSFLSLPFRALSSTAGQ